MNPLTLVKRIKEINSKEAALGISEDASWHAKYKDSAYVFVGGLPYDLSEGDLLAIFSQYGEIVDVNLVRDKATGKSKGYAFVAYEDQRSTNLAVDNLNGANVVGRTIRVDHVSNYKKKEEVDEDVEQQKREERGVCHAFQRGDCTRGSSCKFSHNEQRAANTGWGHKDDSSTWEHDKHENPPIKSGRSGAKPLDRIPESRGQKGALNLRSDDRVKRFSREDDDNAGREDCLRGSETYQDKRGVSRRSENSEKEQSHTQTVEKRSRKYESELSVKEDWDLRRRDKSSRLESQQNSREDCDRKEKSGRYESASNPREDRDRKGREEKLGQHELKQNRKDDYNRRGEQQPRNYEKVGRYESSSNPREDRDRKGKEEKSRQYEKEQDRKDDYNRKGEKRSRNDEDFSSRHYREETEVHARRAPR
ncbi:RNA-binding motif protein, X-linked [Thalictrum thalictroides]|uniref:RNA-binding motif protein, X-linked n=1 Tax=Thalictrum thalictroides TaxID=46969 RepID=A0A7J6W912_THATH|nr:RNA-binding motif protein, X-linked [Thalictrum thalictroides]